MKKTQKSAAKPVYGPDITVDQLVSVTNDDLRKLGKSEERPWRLSSNSSLGMDYVGSAMVLSPKDIPLYCHEDASVPSNISKAVLRRYELEFLGSTNIVIPELEEELEAIAA